MITEAFNAVKDQMGPCGISCGACVLGNGTVSETATNLKGYLEFADVPSWAPLIPGGKEIDFDVLKKTLDWINTYVRCMGCEQGGGPPDCIIRTCAKDKKLTICSDCPELEDCKKFEWLGESVKKNLKNSRGKSKKELIEQAISNIKL